MSEDEQPINLADSIRRKIAESQDSAGLPSKTSQPSALQVHLEFPETKGNSLLGSKIREIGEKIFKDNVQTSEGSRYDAVNARIRELVDKAAGPFTQAERGQLLEGVRDEVFGFGPLGALLRDPTIEHIFVNGCSKIYVVRLGRKEKSNIGFEDEKHLYSTIEKILQPLKLQLDENNPMVTARMPNGATVEICGPPLSVDGPTMTINPFVSQIFSLGQMVERGMISTELAEVLRQHVKNRANIVISGFGDVSQSLLVSALSAHIDPQERVISVEPLLKLRLMQEHWIRFENSNPEQSVSMRSLVTKALRMRPDRLVLGECRGEEAHELLEACAYGSTRSIMVVNASSTTDCLRQLAKMVSAGDPKMPIEQVRELIVAGTQIVVHMRRVEDGNCRVTEVSELTGVEGDQIVTATLFN